MRILGIDPGSVTTGFGVIEQVKGRLALIEQGTIGTVRGSELADRLCRIHDELVGVIRRCAPEAVAVEAPFGGQNVKSLIQLAHARGVILLAARSAKLDVFEYSPRSVKSAVVGYGAAEKEQVAKMVRMLLPGCAQSGHVDRRLRRAGRRHLPRAHRRNGREVADRSMSSSLPQEETVEANARTGIPRGRFQRTFSALRYRDFRLLWFGAFASTTGTFMQTLAQGWLVYTMTGSALLLGVDGFLATGPMLLFSLFGGVIADRMERRKIMLLSQVLQRSFALDPGGAHLLSHRQDLAHLHPLVSDRERAVDQRTGVRVAAAAAGEARRHGQRRGHELDAVQPRARDRPGARRRRLRTVGRDGLLRHQRPLVRLRDHRAD